MTARTAEGVDVGRLPGQYVVWLGGALISQVGDAALYFALGWAASGALSRALALKQSGTQLVSMIGGPVGGALVAFAGFAAASLTDSVSFAVVLVALIAIKPRFAPPAAPRRNILRESADGIRVALKTPGLGAVLLLVAGVAGFVLPATSLLVPLIAPARSR